MFMVFCGGGKVPLVVEEEEQDEENLRGKERIARKLKLGKVF